MGRVVCAVQSNRVGIPRCCHSPAEDAAGGKESRTLAREIDLIGDKRRACPPACLQGHLQLLAKTNENGQPLRRDRPGLFYSVVSVLSTGVGASVPLPSPFEAVIRSLPKAISGSLMELQSNRSNAAIFISHPLHCQLPRRRQHP